MPTVTVDPVNEYPNALLMTWQHAVEKNHVAPAFEKIINYLDASQTSSYVIVDLRSNPDFPIVETMRRALSAYDHPRLKAWLVVGSNSLAKQIEGFLSMVTGRKNVFWFDTLEESYRHIDSHQ